VNVGTSVFFTGGTALLGAEPWVLGWPNFEILRSAYPRRREGQEFTLSGTFEDQNPDDVHTVSIRWGDGQQLGVNVPVGARSFEFTHTYEDDAERAQDGCYTVSVTISDDVGLSDSASRSITVRT